MSKIKNVKLANVLQQMMKQNSTQVVQKMLWAVVSDITVKNILTSKLMTHKLMFKLSKSDIIFKISETEGQHQQPLNISVIQCSLLICQFKNNSEGWRRLSISID
jgi:hypothetical protein